MDDVGVEEARWRGEHQMGGRTAGRCKHFIFHSIRTPQKSHTSCSLLLFKLLSSSRRPLFAFEDSSLVICLTLRTSKRQSGHDLIDLLPTLASRLSPPLLPPRT